MEVLVNCDCSQPPQRWLNRIPAKRAIKSISEGQMYRTLTGKISTPLELKCTC